MKRELVDLLISISDLGKVSGLENTYRLSTVLTRTPRLIKDDLLLQILIDHEKIKSSNIGRETLVLFINVKALERAISNINDSDLCIEQVKDLDFHKDKLKNQLLIILSNC